MEYYQKNLNNKIMKPRLLLASSMLIACVTLSARPNTEPELKTEIFEHLDLDYPGLEEVKAHYLEGKPDEAAAALLEYYKGRTGICTPDITDVSKVKISKEHQKWADDALEHRFFVMDAYKEPFHYGDDINWRYWPVQDNELRWQLHRQKWFIPMGKAYRISGDEKYAIEWTKQYVDWIRKNPLVVISKDEYEIVNNSELKEDAENARWAWRPLETSTRLQDQTQQFQLFITSPAFTADFLTEFLVNYHRHAEHVIGNYSEHGNHLLFQAQRMLYAGTFFPEFKRARIWRESGMSIMNEEIGKQVYEDGGHYELCPHYHLATINIFIKALNVATLNGFRHEFPQSYIDTIEKMIMMHADISYPDYTHPYFSDARSLKKSDMLRNYRNWSRLFPENQAIRYWATEGREGALPNHLSKGYLNTGFFTFRNSWKNDCLQMVVKAGPPAYWHNQPDNGTFEIWYNGKPLFQDSGAYVYGGGEEIMQWRNWFRRTASHNTMTFADRDLERMDSKTLLWQPEGDIQILVTENKSYSYMTHRRSIFFVDGKYFVIVDEGTGKGEGWVNLHYQMPPGKTIGTREDMHFHTEMADGCNMKLQCFGPKDLGMKMEEGWVSSDIKLKRKRINANFHARKAGDKPVRFITVIVPKEEPGDEPSISASFIDGYSANSMKLEVKVGKEKKRILGYTL